MAVERIEEYRQQDGSDILKVITKPTKKYPEERYFYCDASDEELVRKYTWSLQNQKQPYVKTNTYGRYHLFFHKEKSHNILSYYPDYINHVNGIEFDNINKNLDIVTSQQNQWSKPSKGYVKNKKCKSFQPYIGVNLQQINASCVRTEPEVCLSAYQLELQYENYRYDFLKDRRNDLDILDPELCRN